MGREQRAAPEVTPTRGKLLHLLVRIRGARSILQIGTLGGYSTLCLARALPADGRLITLESERGRAAVASERIARAGLTDRVDFRVGPALYSLPLLAAEGLGPFDVVFIDAVKRSDPDYLGWALELSRPGTVIVADNVVCRGEAASAASFHDLLAAEPRLSATAVQTVGWDGFTLALVD